MTPAERARQIDKQEFEAECQSVRRRALRYSKQRRRDEQRRIRRWIETPIVETIHSGHNAEQRARIQLRALKEGRPAGRKPRIAKPSILHTVNGEAKTLSEWSELAGVSYRVMQKRLKDGIPLATAITMKPCERVRANVHTVNGVTKTLRLWAEHIGVSYGTLFGRMRSGRTLAEAIAMPSGRHPKTGPGVSADFGPLKGTGAGSTAQETLNITFEEKAE